MGSRLSRRVVAAAVATMALIAAGGIAYANIPDANGVIHACYKKTSPNQGTLSVIDTEKGQTCSGGAIPLTWNQTGPQGAPGAPGAPGTPGAPGPQGPSDAWFADQASAQVPVLGSAIVVSVTVPAGTYLLSSEVGTAGATDSTGAFCLFKTPTSGTTVSASFADQTLTPDTAEIFAMTGTATVPTGTAEIDVECQDRIQPSTSAYSATANLTALQVGALH
jgi:hypothetical protein